eukprot:gene16002-17616_t
MVLLFGETYALNELYVMDAVIEVFKPCLVLIGPLLFFAFKRLCEFKEARKGKECDLTMQDFVEKLTKTPLHMKQFRKVYNKEKEMLFNKEKNLRCKCRALQHRLDNEICRSDHLYSLYIEQVVSQGELLKEIHRLKITLKKVRKKHYRQKKALSKFNGKVDIYHKRNWIPCCCSQDGLRNGCRESFMPIKTQSTMEESFDKDFCDDSDGYDGNEKQENGNCNYKQPNYYQTFFS